MVSLIDRKPPSESITLIHPQSSGAEPKYIDTYKLQVYLGVLKGAILSAHAFTWTDTTSAAYRRGKAEACEMLRQNSSLRAKLDIFYDKDASQEEIYVAAEHFF